jgi:hypothetical protein
MTNFAFNSDQWINLTQASKRSGLPVKMLRVRIGNGEILAQKAPSFSGKPQILVRWGDIQVLSSYQLSSIVTCKWSYLQYPLQKACDSLYKEHAKEWNKYFGSPRKGRQPVLTTSDDFFQWSPRYAFWLYCLEKVKHDLTKNFYDVIVKFIEEAKQKAHDYINKNFDEINCEYIDTSEYFVEVVDYFLYNKRSIKKISNKFEEKGKSRKEYSFENIENFSYESSDDIAYKKLLVKEVLKILDDCERTVFEEKAIEGLTLEQIVNKYSKNKDLKITSVNKASRIYNSACRKIQEKVM